MKRLKNFLLFPLKVLALLESIDRRLANIERTSKGVDECMTSTNHRKHKCLITGHWND